MADEAYDPFDDLDAFFSAADKSDTSAMQQAAENVAGTTRVVGKSAPAPVSAQSQKSGKSPTSLRPSSDAPSVEINNGQLSLDGKFIAIEPEPGSAQSAHPFILIPANIHAFLPWWGWLTIGMGLLIMIIGVIVTPLITLDRVAARLGDSSESTAQSAMRQLVIRGDERTVGKLYDMASSANQKMETRLRAVDTLGLIQAADADRALLRLELAGNTEARVREAAIAARRQREAANARTARP